MNGSNAKAAPQRRVARRMAGKGRMRSLTCVGRTAGSPAYSLSENGEQEHPTHHGKS
jgi:hypothetical protein